MAASRKLTHHYFTVDQVFGTAETYKADFQEDSFVSADRNGLASNHRTTYNPLRQSLRQPCYSRAVRILIIDDDAELCALLKELLQREGYTVECETDGRRGLDAALHGDFRLAVLDVMLPGMDGFEILRRLRNQSKLPVLMLTARGEDTDRIIGLELGADDYLSKPFNPRELAARIRAILRRMEPVTPLPADSKSTASRSTRDRVRRGAAANPSN
jgi:CheY-like chemotaxis protein